MTLRVLLYANFHLGYTRLIKISEKSTSILLMNFSHLKMPGLHIVPVDNYCVFDSQLDKYSKI